MRKTKAIIAMLIILCMVMAFVPFRVFATLPYANLNVSFENTYNSSNGTVQYKNSDDEWVSVASDTNGLMAKAVRIINVAEGYTLANYSALRKDGTAQDITNIFSEDGVALENDGNYDLEHVDLVSSNPSEPDDPPMSGEEFNGTAWFIWNENGNVCKYKVENLQGAIDNEGAWEYPVNYIKESDVVDGTNKLEISNLSNTDYYWVWDDKIDVLNDKTTWKQLEDYIEILDYDEKRAFVIDPTQAREGNNSICTNGDREFRATIYDDSKYESIVFGVKEDDYTYFPADWDPIFINSEVDISGTTRTNPAVYEMYLLEPNLKFSSGTVNNSRIMKVTALDVNKDAVTITESNGEYKIVFNSNYYDSVVFEITDQNNNKYYLQIDRIVMKTYDNMRDETATSLQSGVLLMYPADSSYNDYEIIAEITYKDGKTKTVKASNIKTLQDIDHLGQGYEVEVNEWDYGKNLKMASYVVDVTDNMTDIYYTVIKKGALDGSTYGGTFAGSGKGLHVDNIQELINDFAHRGEERD